MARLLSSRFGAAAVLVWVSSAISLGGCSDAIGTDDSEPFEDASAAPQRDAAVNPEPAAEPEPSTGTDDDADDDAQDDDESPVEPPPDGGLDAGADDTPDSGAVADAGSPEEGDATLDAGPAAPPLELLAPRKLATGAYHTCAIDEEAVVFCWGENLSGQLGDGTMTLSVTPVPSVTGAVEIGVGTSHTCALLDDGKVSCWGDNVYGQLGDGTTDPSPTPQLVDGVRGAVRLAVGGHHSCALLDDGRVMCWGGNEMGQLGAGTITPSSGAVRAGSLLGVVQITLGEASSCALSSDRTIACWGANDWGQLGSERSEANPSPSEVELGVRDVAMLSLGSHNGCAVRDNGLVLCWGTNEYGQLGADIDPSPMSFPPLMVADIGSAVAVSVGDYHACALLDYGTLECWGDSFFGSVGVPLPDEAPYTLAPVLVEGLDAVSEVSAGGILGGNTTCALSDDGETKAAHCWGRGTWGNLGDGNRAHSDQPLPVLGF